MPKLRAVSERTLQREEGPGVGVSMVRCGTGMSVTVPPLPYHTLLTKNNTNEKQHAWHGFFFCSSSLHHRDGLFGGGSLILTDDGKQDPIECPFLRRWQDDKMSHRSARVRDVHRRLLAG